jgi:NAD(P)-dependent dehydrogenase (short-subunit alcohol dehydrogenase family)
MNIFITGASSGIGLELAKLFLKDGHTVGTYAFESFEDVKDVVPSDMKYYQGNVVDTLEVKKAMEQFHSEVGTLDIVVANAGISMTKARIPDFDRGRRVIETNVIGVLNTFEPAINIMKEQGNGQLVALGSISGLSALPGMAIYGASKAAVINICQSMDIDLYHYGISVTALAPGFISTPLVKDNKHTMPFMMTPIEAAMKIQKAIYKKKSLYVFPFPMSMVSVFLRYIPKALYRAFMKRDFLGMQKG